MLFFKSNKQEDQKIILPVHIAIKMDGNGRWAKKRGLPRKVGHSEGAKTFRTITRYCNKIGIQYLTVYAFSTENWNRPKEEVDALMNLFRQYLKEAYDDFQGENIKTRFIGDRGPLAEDIQNLMHEDEEASKNATGLTLNIAINYGGRQEIASAARKAARDVLNGTIKIEDIDESAIQRRIYTAEQPDPDLIIMSGGEIRISNFLLWQSAYAEYWFTDILWPDFTPHDIDRAVADYSLRNRRFGGI